MLGRNPRPQLLVRKSALLVLHLVWNKKIDTVRPTFDARVNPLQLDFQTLWCVPDSAEHAETPSVRHLGHDIAAMSESEQWKFDTQLLAERRFHDCFSFLFGRKGLRPSRI